MSNRNMKSVLSGLAALMLLSATPHGVSNASAQEAITLERIGAVRMSRPEAPQGTAAGQAILGTPQRRQPHEGTN